MMRAHVRVGKDRRAQADVSAFRKKRTLLKRDHQLHEALDGQGRPEDHLEQRVSEAADQVHLGAA